MLLRMAHSLLQSLPLAGLLAGLGTCWNLLGPWSWAEIRFFSQRIFMADLPLQPLYLLEFLLL